MSYRHRGLHPKRPCHRRRFRRGRPRFRRRLPHLVLVEYHPLATRTRPSKTKRSCFLGRLLKNWGRYRHVPNLRQEDRPCRRLQKAPAQALRAARAQVPPGQAPVGQLGPEVRRVGQAAARAGAAVLRLPVVGRGSSCPCDRSRAGNHADGICSMQSVRQALERYL